MFRLQSMTTWTLALSLAVGWLSASVDSTVEEDEDLCQPRHVHLSLGEAEDQMAVVWATKNQCDTQVLYGTSPWLMNHPNTTHVDGREEKYTEHNVNGLHWLHKALLKGLKGSQTYFYRTTSNQIDAGPFFLQVPTRGTEWSPELLVVSDLGPRLDLLPLLTEQTLSGNYTAVLQLGGLSPFLKDPNGTRGDSLMTGLEHIASFIPVMTTPGESETPSGQYPGYRHRFSMPGSQWPMREEKLWYSFNLGPVHFVSLCTDIYLKGNKTLQTLQYKWLVKDLSKANTERETRPWIVAMGYHPLYCTPDSSDVSSDHDCAKDDSLVRKGLEETLYYYGVDLVLLSHPHSSYERLYPLFKGVVASTNFTNPRAPVHILTGGAAAPTPTPTAATTNKPDTQPVAADVPSENGTSSSSSSDSSSSSSSSSSDSSSSSSSSSSSGGGGGSSDKANEKNGEVKSGDSSKDALTAFKFVNGTQTTYGRLHVINATHAHWELLAGTSGKDGGEKEERKVLDSVVLVQEHHGKFHISELPDDVEKKIDENLVANGGKPGVLNVHDPVLETKKMLAADDSRRLIIGASFGAVILVIIVVAIIIKVKGKAKRRSVRRWDVMDYKYGKTKLYTPTNDEEDEDDDFQDDHDFEMDIPDGSMQTKKLINGK